MFLGETVCRLASVYENSKSSTETAAMYGKVIYIHPKGRFHAVEFEYKFGRKIVECFDGVRG